VPRQLGVLADGRLASRPIAELKALRAPIEGASVRNLPLGPGSPNPLAAVRGDALDLQLTFDFTGADATAVALRVRQSSADATEVRYEPGSQTLTLDTRRAGMGDRGVYQAHVPPAADGRLRLRVLVDRSSVEVFANDGATAMTARIYPRYEESTGVQLVAEGGSIRVASADAWRMRSAWG
jgi:beta-fructofuranosidase